MCSMTRTSWRSTRSVTMYPTTEVRWFFYGTIPPHVDLWFGEVGCDPAEGERTDHYLGMPDVDTVGVKWREGRLEVKRRQADLGEVAFAAEVVGRLGRWHKWIFGLDDVEVLEALRTASDWIAVAKSRRLHAYAADEAGRVHNVSPEIVPRSGCELEVGTVKIGGKTWWTVAFEAFGDEAAQPAVLRRTVAHVLQMEDAPTLPVAASASYPRWLASLLSEKD